MGSKPHMKALYEGNHIKDGGHEMTDRLDRHTLHWIIVTYDYVQKTAVDDVPTLLFERLFFSEREVRDAIGLGPDDDFMEGLSAYLEDNHGICDLA